MDRDSIIKTLKSACGNKNFRFQVIIDKSKLHIYINRKADYTPNYILLTDTITQAISGLHLNSLAGIWLYSRELGEVKPDWQVFVESPKETANEEMDTLGNGQKDLILEEDTSPQEEINFPEFEDYLEVDSVGDTGLLKKTGMIHQKPLEEEDISISVAEIKVNASETNTDLNPLAKYCFVTNKKILTGDIIAPDKEVIRLVRFFHHLSETNQQRILPFVEEYFNKGKTSDTQKLPPVITKWLKQIIELNEKNRKAIAIWLSRYCFDSSTTLVELKEMEDKQAELKATRKKAKRSNTQYTFTPASSETPRYQKQLSYLTEDKFQLPPIVEKSIIPLVWTVATIVLISLGIYTNHSDIHATSGQVPEICQTSIGSANYCRLGVNLAGKEAIQQSSTGIFPLTEVTETVANFGCERFANVKAGAFSNLDPQQNPVLSSYGEKKFPNIYVVEAVQQDTILSKNIRVGCVYTTGAGERSPTKLASDAIPLNWPTEHYQQEAVSESNLSFGIYTNLINLGLFTLFSAIGIAIASQFRLGINITNRPQTIYLVALILGIVQLLAINLPILNLIASIAFSVIAIIIISQSIKSFNLNLQDGFPLVSVGILTIIAIQFLLYGICWQLITSLI
ncbi:MAG: hypothetical protein ACFCAD_10505 [Pleurocapsa sp.]